MNASFFILLACIKPYFLSIKRVMGVHLSEKIGFKERMVQLFLWSLLFTLVSLPIHEVCVVMIDLSTHQPALTTFWLLIDLLFIQLGFLGAIVTFVIGIAVVAAFCVFFFLKLIGR